MTGGDAPVCPITHWPTAEGFYVVRNVADDGGVFDTWNTVHYWDRRCWTPEVRCGVERTSHAFSTREEAERWKGRL